MERPSTFREAVVVTNADAIRQLSCSEALRQRNPNLKLFTPALLLTHGGFDRDPVQEFVARFEVPKDKQPFVVQLRRDNDCFFESLGTKPIGDPRFPVDWDRRLYAIDDDYADECFGFLGGIAWSNPRTGMFASTMSYDMEIVDPTQPYNFDSSRLDFLTVKIFGVMANRFVAYMHHRPGQCPIARRIPFDGKVLPASIPKTNFLGVAPQEDPLLMRED
jgi:hypothetical protein